MLGFIIQYVSLISTRQPGICLFCLLWWTANKCQQGRAGDLCPEIFSNWSGDYKNKCTSTRTHDDIDFHYILHMLLTRKDCQWALVMQALVAWLHCYLRSWRRCLRLRGMQARLTMTKWQNHDGTHQIFVYVIRVILTHSCTCWLTQM